MFAPNTSLDTSVSHDPIQLQAHVQLKILTPLRSLRQQVSPLNHAHITCAQNCASALATLFSGSDPLGRPFMKGAAAEALATTFGQFIDAAQQLAGSDPNMLLGRLLLASQISERTADDLDSQLQPPIQHWLDRQQHPLPLGNPDPQGDSQRTTSLLQQIVASALASYQAQMGNGPDQEPLPSLPPSPLDPKGSFGYFLTQLSLSLQTATSHCPPCNDQDCTLTFPPSRPGEKSHTYTLAALRANPSLRKQFLEDFYSTFAPGYGQAEIDFWTYLDSSHRLSKHGGYWDFTDFALIQDQFFAAYNTLYHQQAQNARVQNWMNFITHWKANEENGKRTENEAAWWQAHNASINYGDQQARDKGLVGQESILEQLFIKETVTVINTIPTLPDGATIFSPRSRLTGLLAQIYYPSDYNDFSDAEAFIKQEETVGLAITNPVAASPLIELLIRVRGTEG
uniref:Uncharacterized protein n=1 Tax=Thermogemmatispora argillosa TaxID=2045280 RepID=A0A455T0E1_9CHLR|nr:hypothetical protein KTA_15990 [Thermogemmatispora argillosa]